MKYIIDKTLNTPEYQQPLKDILKSDDVWVDVKKDKNMIEYKNLMESNNYSYQTSYSILVKGVPLQINHRLIMKSGMEYLYSKDVVVSMEDYFTEYNNWYPSFSMELNSKSEVNMSCEDLSFSPDNKKYKDFVVGQKQYLLGWIGHLGSMVEPDKVTIKSGDNTGKYSSLFQKNKEMISEISGSNS